MVNIESVQQEEVANRECYHIEKVQKSKFDIVCYLKEYKNGLEINCHYSKEYFKPGTIETLMNLYRKVLDNISAEPGKKIEEYSFTGKKKIIERNIRPVMNRMEARR